MTANAAGEHEFHAANIILTLFFSLLFLYFTTDTVLRIRAGASGGWLIYVEPVIFVACARAFFRSGREYLRERGQAPRLLKVLDFIARNYLRGAVNAGVALIGAYGLDAALHGDGVVVFYARARLILFIVGAFVLLNVYLDHIASSRQIAVLDESRLAHQPPSTGSGNNTSPTTMKE